MLVQIPVISKLHFVRQDIRPSSKEEYSHSATICGPEGLVLHQGMSFPSQTMGLKDKAAQLISKEGGSCLHNLPIIRFGRSRVNCLLDQRRLKAADDLEPKIWKNAIESQIQQLVFIAALIS